MHPLRIYNESVFIFALQTKVLRRNSKSKIFYIRILRNVVIVAAKKWGKCPFGIFGAIGKCDANNTWRVAFCTILHILYILVEMYIIKWGYGTSCDCRGVECVEWVQYNVLVTLKYRYKYFQSITTWSASVDLYGSVSVGSKQKDQ